VIVCCHLERPVDVDAGLIQPRVIPASGLPAGRAATSSSVPRFRRARVRGVCPLPLLVRMEVRSALTYPAPLDVSPLGLRQHRRPHRRLPSTMPSSPSQRAHPTAPRHLAEHSWLRRAGPDASPPDEVAAARSALRPPASVRSEPAIAPRLPSALRRVLAADLPRPVIRVAPRPCARRVGTNAPPIVPATGRGVRRLPALLSLAVVVGLSRPHVRRAAVLAKTPGRGCRCICLEGPSRPSPRVSMCRLGAPARLDIKSRTGAGLWPGSRGMGQPRKLSATSPVRRPVVLGAGFPHAAVDSVPGEDVALVRLQLNRSHLGHQRRAGSSISSRVRCAGPRRTWARRCAIAGLLGAGVCHPQPPRVDRQKWPMSRHAGASASRRLQREQRGAACAVAGRERQARERISTRAIASRAASYGRSRTSSRPCPARSLACVSTRRRRRSAG
jgi:hypothetical protein